MVTKTGWIVEEPDAAPALPLTSFILANRPPPGEGHTLGAVLARAAQAPDRRGREPDPVDPDEHAANLINRGYHPGLLQELSGQLGDCQAELEAEKERIERGQRRAEHVRRAFEAGQIRALDIPAALGDEGDPDRVAFLERRAASLQRQIADATEAVSPPERRTPDPLEAAASRARGVLAMVEDERRAEDEREARARAQMAADRASFRRSWRGGGVSRRSQQPTAVLESHSEAAGGPGFGPWNVPWSQVGTWLRRGWRP